MKINKLGKVFDSPSEIKEKCIKWLVRIGVHKSDIDFDYVRSEGWAEVIFIYEKKEYQYRSEKQKGFKENLKACELFIHSKVLNMERGIEEFEQAFKGYMQLEHNIKSNYFRDCETKSELEHKKKELVKKLHPDVNGDANDFKEMMKQYNDKMGDFL